MGFVCKDATNMHGEDAIKAMTAFCAPATGAGTRLAANAR
jgi:hypothetical protein